jgi:hypothetical protein
MLLCMVAMITEPSGKYGAVERRRNILLKSILEKIGSETNEFK